MRRYRRCAQRVTQSDIGGALTSLSPKATTSSRQLAIRRVIPREFTGTCSDQRYIGMYRRVVLCVPHRARATHIVAFWPVTRREAQQCNAGYEAHTNFLLS